jgi:DNA repair protein SbcC/Rad50
MILKLLHIHNIRSYQDETIVFPAGSTLLSGDIGSGKSSILLAIEFALFGASRTELSAESLLRKGETNAAVELSFSLDKNEIVIKRTLKKDSRSIKQTNGYIIINGVKKDLTPVELKAEIIGLLGYPEDLLTKDKNFVFRYTVYCPQEDMKQILLENPENRLDILRKIFNIEKYKNIRDNLIIYLKKCRKEITVLETKVEPLEEVQLKLKNVETELEKLEKELKELLPKLNLVSEEIRVKKKRLSEHEELVKKIDDVENNIKHKKILLTEHKEQSQRISVKEKELGLQLKEFIMDQRLGKEQVFEEIKKLEHEKDKFSEKEANLKAEIKTCQDKIAYFQKELNESKVDPKILEEKKLRLGLLNSEVKKKGELLAREKELADLEKTNQEILTETSTLQKQLVEENSRISSLDKCPTCLQQINSDYKKDLVGENEVKIGRFQKKLNQLRQEQEGLAVSREELDGQVEKLSQVEKELNGLELEIKVIKEKSLRFDVKKEELRKIVQENNNLMERLGEFERDKELNLKRVEERLEQLQKLREKLVRKEELEKQFNSLVKDRSEVNSKIELLEKELIEFEAEMGKLPAKDELIKHINSEKEKLEEIVNDEKRLLLEKTRLETSKEHLNRKCVELKEELDILQKNQKELVKVKELYHWLNNYFLKLTYTIEKEILVKIYHYFNQLFQEWFDILVEDSEINSSLDESFTPIVEQNGYDISFQHLSGGERTAVSLAYRLALNKVINDVVHQVKTKDLLILDEPTDGFSSEQLDKVRDLIDKLGLGQIIIVSHEFKIESFVNNVIRIGKMEHCSKVVN